MDEQPPFIPAPAADGASATPAHVVWAQLATRITTQHLHYRSGDEETAAESVHALFGVTRELIIKHDDGTAFRYYALALLNATLRPYTARWHGWMTGDDAEVGQGGKPALKFRDEWLRRKFREELLELQPSLMAYQKIFEALSKRKTPEEGEVEMIKQACRPRHEHARLGANLPLALRGEVPLYEAGHDGRENRLLTNQIEACEKEAIGRRRAAFGMMPEAGEHKSGTIDNATGLALSGGGIRSATFCLGIVQTLQRLKIFHQFDYLSTVSGGGYLGSFISCYLGVDPNGVATVEEHIENERGKTLEHTTAPQAEAVPDQPARGRLTPAGKAALALLAETFLPQTGESEPPPMRHLRNNSRYLLNGGTWGLLRIGGLVLTGVLTSTLMLLTLPLGAAWALRGLKAPATTKFFARHSWLLAPWREWLWYGGPTLACFVAGWGFALWWGGKRRSGAERPVENLCLKLAVFLAVTAMIIWTAAVIRSVGWFLVGWLDLHSPSQWEHPSMVALLGVCGLLGLCWFFTPLAQRFAEGAKWNSVAADVCSLVESMTLLMALVTCGFAAVYLAPLFVVWYEDLGRALAEWTQRLVAWKPPEFVTPTLLSFVPLIFGGLTKRKDGSVRIWARLLFQLTAAVFFLTAFLIFASNLGVGRRPGWNLAVAGAATEALFIWTFVFVNINTFAPHRYYRNRLCECYLVMRNRQQNTWLRRMTDRIFHGSSNSGRMEQCEDIGTLQRLPLTALGSSLAAPYHLINATINAEASKNPDLRGRNGDFFLFSRHYCGSPLTGYMATEDLEKTDPHCDLGTAMAVSGAAASTNMGWQTMRQLRFLLTLFNVRLGYWLRRPGSTALPRPLAGPGPTYFLCEMLGMVHEKLRYVNLSDGGHIENLAAYELLRRQCKFIVCVDAGMEPKMECADLMRLQRYAAIDFGIQMYFDPSDLTLLPTNYSRAYAILVKIDYGPTEDPVAGKPSNEIGWMLYLKLAVTGTEPRYVLDYRRQNPAFPHQTTVDQFYDEAQFEAYRALGEAAAESLFREELVGDLQRAGLDVHTWFQALADNLLPDNDEAFKEPPVATPAEQSVEAPGK